jgi:hemerythrin-like domain-containing protein
MDTIQEALTREHHRLLALLDGAVRELTTGEDDAMKAVTSFARRLRAQLRIEEEVLFPAAERVVQDNEFATTTALRREHAVFKKLLAAIEQDLERGQRGAAAGDLCELRAALRLHLDKARQIVFPMVERRLQATTILELADLLDAEHVH